MLSDWIEIMSVVSCTPWAYALCRMAWFSIATASILTQIIRQVPDAHFCNVDCGVLVLCWLVSFWQGNSPQKYIGARQKVKSSGQFCYVHPCTMPIMLKNAPPSARRGKKEDIREREEVQKMLILHLQSVRTHFKYAVQVTRAKGPGWRGRPRREVNF